MIKISKQKNKTNLFYYHMIRIFVFKGTVKCSKVAQFGPIVMGIGEVEFNTKPIATINIEVDGNPVHFGIDGELLPFFKRRKGYAYPRISEDSENYKPYMAQFENSLCAMIPENEQPLSMAIVIEDDVVIDMEAVNAVIEAAVNNPGETFTTDTIFSNWLQTGGGVNRIETAPPLNEKIRSRILLNKYN